MPASSSQTNLNIRIRTVNDPEVLTVGLREEYDNCQRDGVPTIIAMVSTLPNSGEENIVVLWLPDDGRAGLSSNHGTGNDPELCSCLTKAET